MHVWDGLVRDAKKAPEERKVSAATLKASKEARSQAALECQRKQRNVDAVAASVAAEAPGVVIDVGGVQTKVPLAMGLECIAGAVAELDGTAAWGLPVFVTAGQKALLRQGGARMTAALAKLEEADKAAYHAARETMTREGSAAPAVEASRLIDVLEARTATLTFLKEEYAMNGTSFKLRDRGAAIAAAGEPPLPPPPANPTDKPAWEAWLNLIDERVGAFKRSIETGAIARIDEARDALHKARAHDNALKTALNGLSAPLRQWMQREGSIRVLTSLQAPERLRLTNTLLGKRSQTYRKMCSEPIDTKIKFRAAVRELNVVEQVGWLPRME